MNANVAPLDPEEHAALMLRRDVALAALRAGELWDYEALLYVVAPTPQLRAASLASARENLREAA